MSSELRYIDTCCVILIIDKDDNHRKVYGCGRKKGEDLFPRNTRFCIPEVVLGEAVMKIMDKRSESFLAAMQEYHRLVGKGFLTVDYIKDPSFVFDLSKKIAREKEDSRDRISPSDALILACAAAEKNCRIFYTSDSKLLTDLSESKAVDDWRLNNGYEKMEISDMDDILKE